MGISRKEALDCFSSDDLIGIGMEADGIRRKVHPENVVTYAVGGSIDCAGPEEHIFRQAKELVEAGATAIMLRGKPGLDCAVGRFATLLASLSGRHPDTVLSLMDSEIAEIARLSGVQIRDAISRLRDAGLGSICGNGGNGIEPHDWVAVHRTAHQLGLQTVATVPFASDGDFEGRIGRLEMIRALQEDTGGFAACMPQVTSGKGFEEPTAVEYLKTLAIARMFLDSVKNVQSGMETSELKVLQVSLRFGANDAGNTETADEEKLRQAIRDAGFQPAQRDALYSTVFLN